MKKKLQFLEQKKGLRPEKGHPDPNSFRFLKKVKNGFMKMVLLDSSTDE